MKIRIKVKLVNMKTKEVVKNENKILLHLGLQTWEIPSNPILRNKTGTDFLYNQSILTRYSRQQGNYG